MLTIQFILQCTKISLCSDRGFWIALIMVLHRVSGNHKNKLIRKNGVHRKMPHNLHDIHLHTDFIYLV